MEDTNLILELEHVEKHYDSPSGSAAVQVLNDISLVVEKGESIAIIGPSGSGKSTLLNIIGALDRPSSGVVRIAGRDLAGLSDAELAEVRNRSIGFVFQLHHLLPQCTVLENVLVPTLPYGTRESSADAGERARTLLEKVGLEERASHRPGQLSGGECQRVAVVRALINQPRLVLADEPTGSLDRASAQGMVQLLSDLHKEYRTTLVMVTHSEELARNMDKLFGLVDGHLDSVG